MKVIKHASINLLVCLFVCLLVEHVSAQGSCAAIGGVYDDAGNSIIQTSDGGYAIAGMTESFGQGNADVYVVKLDGSGNIQWTRTIGSTNWDEGYSIIQTSDGGYAIAGMTESFGQGNADVYVVKLDGSGNIQWTRTIGGASYDEGYSIIHTSDGGYAIAGYTGSFGQGLEDVYVVKLDGSGNIQWTRTIGGASWDGGYSIIHTSDGGYAITGYTGSFGQGGYDVYVVKLDGSGNIQWTRTIGGASYDEGYSIIHTSDGGYAIAGRTNSFGQGGYDVYVVKLDGSGNIQWTRTIGSASYDVGSSIIQTSDGGYAIAGRTNSFGQGDDVYVVKLDANGNISVTGCPCSADTGGTASTGGVDSTGGVGGTGGAAGSGGITSSGGTTQICEGVSTGISTFEVSSAGSSCRLLESNEGLPILTCSSPIRLVSIYTVEGKHLLTIRRTASAKQPLMLPEAESFSRGVYILTAKTEAGIHKLKLIR